MVTPKKQKKLKKVHISLYVSPEVFQFYKLRAAKEGVFLYNLAEEALWLNMKYYLKAEIAEKKAKVALAKGNVPIQDELNIADLRGELKLVEAKIDETLSEREEMKKSRLKEEDD